MKDKLLQLLNGIENALNYSRGNMDILGTFEAITKAQSSVSEAKQLLSAPIAEQGKSAEGVFVKEINEYTIRVLGRNYILETFAQEQMRMKYNEGLENGRTIHVAQIEECHRFASQSPIKQEVSEEEIYKMAEKSYKEYSQSQHISNEFDFTVGFGRGFKAGQQHSIGKVTDEEIQKFCRDAVTKDNTVEFTESRILSASLVELGAKWMRDKLTNNTKTE